MILVGSSPTLTIMKNSKPKGGEVIQEISNSRKRFGKKSKAREGQE